MKLISMTDFVFEIGNKDETTHRENLVHIYNYAIFLKQPLKLEMFVPCDENGNILEDVTGQGMIPYYVEKVHRFLTAKEKVLFDGFYIRNNPKVESFKYIGFEYYEEPIFILKSNNKIIRPENKSFHTIEDLLRKKDIELTKTAIKRIFG